MAWRPDYITLNELKVYLRIPLADTEDDADLAVDITAASRAIDDHCNRQFGLVTAEQRFYTAWPDYERGKWIVDVDDFQSVVGLAVAVDGVAALTTDFVKEPVNAAAESLPWTRLAFETDASVQPTGADHEVAVTLPWGWTAVPVPVKLGTRLQSSRFNSRRDSPYGIAGSPDTGSEMRLLARVDPDVGVSLRGLVRPRAVG